jgi:hypothetical protein
MDGSIFPQPIFQRAGRYYLFYRRWKYHPGIFIADKEGMRGPDKIEIKIGEVIGSIR